jgi:hypothetical protein
MLLTPYISSLIAGFGGGALRGIIGYLKHQYDYKNVGFDTKYFLGMSFLSGIVGLLVSVAIGESGMLESVIAFSPAIAFVVGYAGGDFLDGMYKILIGKTKGEK